jgi:hypothetical protein
VAIDFTLSPELEALRLRVRDFIDTVADGRDEVHQMRIAQRAIAAYKQDGSTRRATGDLPV